MTQTKIEWTESVWNPVTGCTKVSQGCKHCYAERMAKRQAGRNGYPAAPYQFDVTLHPEKLEEPLHWEKPRRVFVNSMSDLFHEKVPDEFIARVFAVMAISKTHTFQILTKRPDRMRKLVSDGGPSVKTWGGAKTFYETIKSVAPEYTMEGLSVKWPLPNVWLGVSCEDQKTADERIPLLLKTPAAVRFVSAEPLLGPVSLQLIPDARNCIVCGDIDHQAFECHHALGQIDWVIVGGESGPDARPMHPDWARSLLDQCIESQTPFFFKQWGEWLPDDQHNPHNRRDQMIGETDMTWQRVGKKKAGSLLDGREWKEYPSFGLLRPTN